MGKVDCGNGDSSISFSNIPDNILVDEYGGDLNTGEDIYIKPFDINNRHTNVYIDIHLLKDKHDVCTSEEVPFWGNDKENGVVDPHKFYEIDRNDLWPSSAYIEDYQGEPWKSDKGEAPVPGTYKVVAKYTKNPSPIDTIDKWKTAYLGKVEVKSEGASEVETGYHYCGRGNPRDYDEVQIFDEQRPLLTDLDGNQLNVGDYVRVNGYKIQGAMGKTYMSLLPIDNHPCDFGGFELIDYYIDGQGGTVDWTEGWEADVDSDTKASQAGEFRVVLRYSAGNVDPGEVLGTWKTWYLGDVEVKPDNEPPKADFETNKEYAGVNVPITFDSKPSSDDKGIEKYRWDLDGDGSYDEGNREKIETEFQTAGVKTVGLKVTDTNGATDTVKKNIEIFELPEGEVQASEEIISLGNEVNFQYNVGEGQYNLNVKIGGETVKNKYIETSGEESGYISYLPEESGSIEAELVVKPEWWNLLESEETIDTASTSIEEAFNEVSINTEQGNGYYSFQTDADSRNTITSIQWDLNNDGSYEKEGRSIQNSFLTPGSKEIRLKVTDNLGNTKTVSENIEIRENGVLSIIERCSIDKDDEKVELEADIADSSDIEASVNISWLIDDEQASRKLSELGKYLEGSTSVEDLEAGDHEVSAVAELDGRILDTQSCGVFNIEPLPEVNPSIELYPSDPEVQETVDFVATPDTEFSYEWDLNGDGEYGRNGREVIEQYEVPGEKSVRVRVITEGTVIGEASRSFTVQQPEVSSSLDVAKDEVAQGEMVQISYSVGEGIVENGFRIVIEDPSGEKIRDSSMNTASGTVSFTPESSSPTGEYEVRLVAEEGFLDAILTSIFGPEDVESFEVLDASEELDVWRSYCQDNGFEQSSASGRVSCIQDQIGPKCFREDPGEECIEIADSVCKYYRGTEFNAEEGRCN
ncbi:PKD domain-containing protein [Candidatus Nanosalina sp. VS9-1]|uniref:PKD domain-containing protein n=1 Tax=Candidatus Nanosalina sp. VS9-1 TaxID=3388566 RepID=UPI0039E05DF8